jgi:hypothetical protein
VVRQRIRTEPITKISTTHAIQPLTVARPKSQHGYEQNTGT